MKTAVIMVLDKSGSMGSLKEEVITSFNNFLKSQKEVNKEGDLFFMAEFSDTLNIVRKWTDIGSVKELTPEEYSPGGFTRYYDSMNDIIDKVDCFFNELETKPDKVLFITITDGQDNVSVLGSKTKLISKMKESSRSNWDFSFAGSNFNVEEESKSLNINKNNSKSFDFNPKGIQTVFGDLSAGVSSYRTTNVRTVYSSDTLDNKS